MSAIETATAVLATAAGLGAVIVEQVSSEAGRGGVLAAGLGGAITIAAAVLLFVGAVPRAKAMSDAGRYTPRTALVTSAVGLASVASAWTGLPFVLGTGGAMLGTAARRGARRPHERAIAAFAIAVGVSAAAVGTMAVIAL